MEPPAARAWRRRGGARAPSPESVYSELVVLSPSVSEGLKLSLKESLLSSSSSFTSKSDMAWLRERHAPWRTCLLLVLRFFLPMFFFDCFNLSPSFAFARRAARLEAFAAAAASASSSAALSWRLRSRLRRRFAF